MGDLLSFFQSLSRPPDNPTEAAHSLIVSRERRNPLLSTNTVAVTQERKYKRNSPHHNVPFAHRKSGTGQQKSFDSSKERNSP
jgi:hypothetical protein